MLVINEPSRLARETTVGPELLRRLVDDEVVVFSAQGGTTSRRARVRVLQTTRKSLEAELPAA